jgi:dCMP deaminase
MVANINIHSYLCKIEMTFLKNEIISYTAERNAIYHAARHGVSLKGCSMYVTMFPCSDCARAIIQSGIKKLITPKPDFSSQIWGKHFEISLEMLREANVDIIIISNDENA